MFLLVSNFQGPEQIHVSKFFKDAKDGKYVNSLADDARTLYQTFRKGVIASNNGPCLGWRDTLQSPYQVFFQQFVIMHGRFKLIMYYVCLTSVDEF